jgi:hypothetical protein
MKSFTLKSIFLIATLLTSVSSFADHLSSKYLFAARINGAQQVPTVNTNAVGLATFYLSADRDTICMEMTATGLSGNITGVHIHAGAAGTNGPVVLDLMPYLNGNRVKATLTGTTVTPQLLTQMFSGMFYINIHTAANPNGEIRGQILPEEDKGFAVDLTGANEVPAVATSARGIGSFILSKKQDKLKFNIVFDGLSGPIMGAHLHLNVAGQNGAVVEDLTTYVMGNRIMGSVNPTAYLNALMSDSIYINVHTAANMNGEVRSQLMVKPWLHLDAMLDTAQETTPVMGGNGMGAAAISINYTFDTLWYHVQANALSGPIQDAHFHKGGLNTAGNVLLGIPSANINGNTISGYVAAPVLSDSFIHFLMEGNVYLNLHTATNGSGEIRGQVYRTFREGYTYHINGAQEVPMISSTASGTGMVSVDRDQTNAHYMMTVNGLMGFGGVHFHKAIPGQNGPVVYDLTSMYANGGLYGYWTDTDPMTPFTTAFSNLFRKDSVYVNFHTTANMNGEVRGNITRKLCNDIPTGVRNLGAIEYTAKLYPNPAQTEAMLDIMLSETADAGIVLTNIMGAKVWMINKMLNAGMNRINIPLQNLPAGMYYITISNKEGQISYKLVKE